MKSENSNTFIDSRGRDIDDVYFYYGKINKAEVDEFELRNRIYKRRDEETKKIPKGGMYCMPEEFFTICNHRYSTDLNKNFRNVQYLYDEDTLYWIYCLKIEHLYQFKFIGQNCSISIAKQILSINGFELGFKRKKYMQYIKEEPLQEIVEVYFNESSLKLLVLRTDGLNITGASMYFRKFENKYPSYTFVTNRLFDNDLMCIPLIDKYEEFDMGDVLYWTSIVDITADGEDKKIFYQDTYDDNNLYFDKENYERMLETIFNKIQTNKQDSNGSLVQYG